MAIYTAQAVKANIRVRDGKRVFYLAEGDHFTPSALDWLKAEGVEVLSASLAKPSEYRTPEGERLTAKPEHMTHLQPDVLVPKDHPRIVFRGCLDRLQAEILLCAGQVSQPWKGRLEEVLELIRRLIRCDVLETPWQEDRICGMTMAELREHSHFPQKYYDQPHFMPSADDGRTLLLLNRLRTMVREAEIRAITAFPDRNDLILVLNRLSSLFWIWMIRLKKEDGDGNKT